MYFEDLSPYSYDSDEPDHGVPVVNVGWLDQEHAFPTGDVPDALCAVILQLCAAPVQVTRGWHDCPFCAVTEEPCRAFLGGMEILLGTAEIRVPGENVIYAAPTLVYHYIREHGYCPPEGFIRALAARAG